MGVDAQKSRRNVFKDIDIWAALLRSCQGCRRTAVWIGSVAVILGLAYSYQLSPAQGDTTSRGSTGTGCWPDTVALAESLVGKPIGRIVPHRPGYNVMMPAGKLFFAESDCQPARIWELQYWWQNQHVPLRLSVPNGPLVHINLALVGKKAVMVVSDRRGLSKSLTLEDIPTSIKCSLQGKLQRCFYTFAQAETEYNQEIVYIVDLSSGPSLDPETIP